MAERRMFAKSIINSARFLRMPPTSRLLYYDLGMAADDDGIVEAFTVLRTTGAAEDDLRVLATKGFIRVLNDDLVSLICDWSANNMIRRDRYTPSIYAGLLVKIEDGNQLTTNGEPMVTQRLTQVSVGKVSVGKESDRADKPPTPARRKYGTYGWVRLADDEYSRLVSDLGQTELDRCIQYVDESAQGNGNKNHWKDWNLVVRRCSREGWGHNRPQQSNDRNRLRTDDEYSGGDFLTEV